MNVYINWKACWFCSSLAFSKILIIWHQRYSSLIVLFCYSHVYFYKLRLKSSKGFLTFVLLSRETNASWIFNTSWQLLLLGTDVETGHKNYYPKRGRHGSVVILALTLQEVVSSSPGAVRDGFQNHYRHIRKEHRWQWIHPWL